MPTLVSDQFLSPNSKRLAVELHAYQDLTPKKNSKSTYRVTADVNEWLKDLPVNIPILLHIDMDYFNNRFNGDSDWELHTNRYDPSVEEVITLIDAMFSALYENGAIDKICDIEVALSPAFFPAELWKPAVDRIRYHLN